jgi:hypothetical protein
MLGVEPATILALLKARATGDEEGALSILRTTDPDVLNLALTAWANEQGRQTMLMIAASYADPCPQCGWHARDASELERYDAMAAWVEQLAIYLMEPPA